MFLKGKYFFTCRLKKQSGIAFKDMLFFDDEHRNIRDLEAHGVTSVLVERGVTMEVVEKGLKIFASRQNK
jgi:magnesium-dependent phosphatase 1